MSAPGTPLRVWLLHPFAVPNRYAAFQRALHLGRGLAAEGCEVTLFTGPAGEPWDELLDAQLLAPHPRLRHEALPAGGGISGFRRAVRRRLGQAETDRLALVGRGAEGFRLLAGRLPPRVTRVLEVHRPPGSTGGPLRRLLERRRALAALARADLVVGVSERVLAAALPPVGVGGRAVPSGVVPSGGPEPAVRLPPEDGREIDVVFAGKLERRKGIGLLLAAMRHLPGRTLAVAGGSAEEVESWRRRAAELGLGERVRFLAWLAPRELAPLWAAARVGVCPLPAGVDPVSDLYTSPMKVPEMMARGVPIAATDVLPVRDLLRHGETALLADPSDPRALAGAVDALLRDRGLARRLALGALDAARELTWTVRARRLRELIEAAARSAANRQR